MKSTYKSGFRSGFRGTLGFSQHSPEDLPSVTNIKGGMGECTLTFHVKLTPELDQHCSSSGVRQG